MGDLSFSSQCVTFILEMMDGTSRTRWMLFIEFRYSRDCPALQLYVIDLLL